MIQCTSLHLHTCQPMTFRLTLPLIYPAFKVHRHHMFHLVNQCTWPAALWTSSQHDSKQETLLMRFCLEVLLKQPFCSTISAWYLAQNTTRVSLPLLWQKNMWFVRKENLSGQCSVSQAVSNSLLPHASHSAFVYIMTYTESKAIACNANSAAMHIL